MSEKETDLNRTKTELTDIRKLFQEQREENRRQQQQLTNLLREQQETNLEQFNRVIDQNRGLADNVSALRRDVTTMKRAVSETIDSRVLMTEDSKKDENVIIVKLSNPDCEFQYAARRVQKCNEDSAIEKLESKHPDCSVLLRFSNQQV